MNLTKDIHFANPVTGRLILNTADARVGKSEKFEMKYIINIACKEFDDISDTAVQVLTACNS